MLALPSLAGDFPLLVWPAEGDGASTATAAAPAGEDGGSAGAVVFAPAQEGELLLAQHLTPYAFGTLFQRKACTLSIRWAAVPSTVASSLAATAGLEGGANTTAATTAGAAAVAAQRVRAVRMAAQTTAGAVGLLPSSAVVSTAGGGNPFRPGPRAMAALEAAGVVASQEEGQNMLLWRGVEVVAAPASSAAVESGGSAPVPSASGPSRVQSLAEAVFWLNMDATVNSSSYVAVLVLHGTALDLPTDKAKARRQVEQRAAARRTLQGSVNAEVTAAQSRCLLLLQSQPQGQSQMLSQHTQPRNAQPQSQSGPAAVPKTASPLSPSPAPVPKPVAATGTSTVGASAAIGSGRGGGSELQSSPPMQAPPVVPAVVPAAAPSLTLAQLRLEAAAAREAAVRPLVASEAPQRDSVQAAETSSWTALMTTFTQEKARLVAATSQRSQDTLSSAPTVASKRAASSTITTTGTSATSLVAPTRPTPPTSSSLHAGQAAVPAIPPTASVTPQPQRLTPSSSSSLPALRPGQVFPSPPTNSSPALPRSTTQCQSQRPNSNATVSTSTSTSAAPSSGMNASRLPPTSSVNRTTTASTSVSDADREAFAERDAAAARALARQWQEEDDARIARSLHQGGGGSDATTDRLDGTTRTAPSSPYGAANNTSGSGMRFGIDRRVPPPDHPAAHHSGGGTGGNGGRSSYQQQPPFSSSASVSGERLVGPQEFTSYEEMAEHDRAVAMRLAAEERHVFNARAERDSAALAQRLAAASSTSPQPSSTASSQAYHTGLSSHQRDVRHSTRQPTATAGRPHPQPQPTASWRGTTTASSTTGSRDSHGSSSSGLRHTGRGAGTGSRAPPAPAPRPTPPPQPPSRPSAHYQQTIDDDEAFARALQASEYDQQGW